MTAYTVYALIGMGASAIFTLIATPIVGALFGLQWMRAVAVVGVLLFFGFLMWGAVTMQTRRGR